MRVVARLGCSSFLIAAREAPTFKPIHDGVRPQTRSLRMLQPLLVPLLILLGAGAASPKAPLAATSHARFVSPLFEDGYLAERSRPALPLLLYAPGFDGTLVSPFLQLPTLSESFDIEGICIEMDDRSTFNALTALVAERVLAEPWDRPCVLMGESFGGLLSMAVALELQRKGRPLAGLVLVNPASSYLESALAERAPGVAALPRWAYALGVLTLLPLFADGYQLPQLLKLVSGQKLPAVIDTPAKEAYMGRVALTLGSRLRFMPRETLRWRLSEWLTRGAEEIRAAEEELRTLELPTCLVVGEADATLPSVAEGERLVRLLPDASLTVVNGAGHAATCGSRANFAQILREKFGHRIPMASQAGRAIAPELAAATSAEAPRSDGARRDLESDDVDFGLIDRPHPVIQPWEYWDFVVPQAPG
jgi:pimeloyl-ACP methyl ester carboxylesterase